jgi:hypothetical protein
LVETNIKAITSLYLPSNSYETSLFASSKSGKSRVKTRVRVASKIVLHEIKAAASERKA